MKTIHALLIATAALLAPFATHAQTAGTTSQDTTGSNVGTATTGTGGVGGDVGAGGTGTIEDGVGAGGTGTTGDGVGAGGTGTTEDGVGAGGTGTTGDDVGTGGSGTTTSSASPSATTAYVPKLTLLAQSTSLRTPGTVKVAVVLSADPALSPAQARSIVVPLASSSGACTVPASATVAWSSTEGGATSVEVACVKARAETVTISSGAATTSFTTK